MMIERQVFKSSIIILKSAIGLGDAGVDGFGLLGDAVPTEGGIDGGPSVAAHATAATEVGQKRSQAPGDRVGRIIDLQAIDAVPDEFGWSSALGADNRLVGRPAFE